jgi:hypothetical protein
MSVSRGKPESSSVRMASVPAKIGSETSQIQAQSDTATLICSVSPTAVRISSPAYFIVVSFLLADVILYQYCRRYVMSTE